MVLRKLRAGLLAAGLFASTSFAVLGQEPKKADVDVTAPKLPTDTAPPAPSPFDQPNEPQDPDASIPQAIRDFAYRGTPFGNFDYNSPGLFGVTGAPQNIFNSPRSFDVLNQTQIQERSDGNTPQLLNGLPGVLIQRTNVGGGSLFVRGLTGNQNLIMIDGIPINDAGWRFRQVQYLNTIDPGVIDRIEIIRGPASVLYGNGAMGGTLNIITKSRKDYCRTFDAGGTIITSYGSALHDPYNRVEVQGNFEGLGVLGGFTNYYPAIGGVSTGQGIGFPDFATEYGQLSGDVRLDWRVSDYSTLTFDYQRLYQNGVPRTDRFPLPQVNPLRFTNQPTNTDQGRDFGYLRWTTFDDGAMWLNGVMFTLDVQRRTEVETIRRLGQTNNRGGITPQARQLTITDDAIHYGHFDARGFTNLSPWHTITYGFTYEYDTSDSLRLQKTAASVNTPINTFNNLPLQPVIPGMPPNGKWMQYGLFISDTLEVTDWWSVNAGVRWSQVDAFGTARSGSTSATTPPVTFNRVFSNLWCAEAGTVFKLTDGFNWFGNFAQGFRAPNLEDLGANEIATAQGLDNGNINLLAERADNYETGFKFRGDRMGGTYAVYYMDLPDFIVRTPGGGRINGRTNQDSYIWGTEGEAYVMVTQNVSLFGNVSYAFGENRAINTPLLVPPVMGVLGTRWSQRRENHGLYAEFWSEMMGNYNRYGFLDFNDIRLPTGGLPAWQTLNLRVGIDVGGCSRLNLSYLNIADQNYRVLNSGVDAPGAEFRVGYQLDF